MTGLAVVEELAGAWPAGTALLDVLRPAMLRRATTGRGLPIHASGAGLKPAPDLGDAVYAAGSVLPTWA